jgi:hypothetical protein
MAQGHKTSSSLRTIAARSRLRPESQTCSPRVNCIETSLFPSLPCLHGKARADGITRTAGHNPQRHVALVNISAISRRRCAADRHTLLRRARSSILTPIYLAARLKPITHTCLLSQGWHTSTDRSSLGSCFEGSQVPPRYIDITINQVSRRAPISLPWHI